MNHQALVLTHEGASPVEKLPYLGVMLAPTPVLEFYGRCATRKPPCHKNDAVFYWWKDQSKNALTKIVPETFWGHLVRSMDSICPQDVGLPYMTDERHANDTLFLVAESDFRFHREHCVSGKNWLAQVDEFVEEHLKRPSTVEAWGLLNPAVPPEEGVISPTTDDEGGGGTAPISEPDWGGTEPDAPAGDSEAEPDARSAKRKEGAEKDKVSFWGFTRGRRYEGREAYVCEELQDLVRIATVAHRKGKGDVVWYSWVGSKKKKTEPSHGSTLVGVSKDGARFLLEAIRKAPQAMHFDIWLRDRCFQETEGLQASYVLPSIGNFDEHISGCDPTNTGMADGTRPSQWNDYWCMDGVRVEKRDAKHKTRNVCAFQSKGVDWGIPVQFGNELTDMYWKTVHPPNPYWEGDETWQNLLRHRGWLDEWGYLSLPKWLTKPRFNTSWRLLQLEPDAHPVDEKTNERSPISRLAEHLVIYYPEDMFAIQGHASRGARDMRDHLMRYKRRCFSSFDEAGYSKNEWKMKVSIRESGIWYCTLSVHAYHGHAFLEADVSWYQPVRARQDDAHVPADALCIVQPFHPGVLNLLYPYADTLAKQRALKQRLQRKPTHGRYERQVHLAPRGAAQVPIVHGAWNLGIPLHGLSHLARSWAQHRHAHLSVRLLLQKALAHRAEQR